MSVGTKSQILFIIPHNRNFRGILCKTTFFNKSARCNKDRKNIQLCVVTELDRNKKQLLSITRKLQQCTIEFVICDLWPCALEIACKKGTHFVYKKHKVQELSTKVISSTLPALLILTLICKNLNTVDLQRILKYNHLIILKNFKSF